MSNKKLHYGFKAFAEHLSLRTRQKLSLQSWDRLDPLKLAKFLDIPIVTFLQLLESGLSERSLSRLLRERGPVSACTLLIGSNAYIAYNPNQPAGRRANSLAHELSHVLLNHDPETNVDEKRHRYWNGVAEAEATWLAGALLVPRDGCIDILRRNASIKDAAEHFDVSEALFSWRMDETGVKKQLNRLMCYGTVEQ